MSSPSRFTICPLAAVAVLVASGCGSSKKTPTEGASTASTTPPANVTGQSSTSTQAQHSTTAAKPKPKVAKAKPRPTEKATTAPSESAAKTPFEREQAEIRAAIREREARRRVASTPTLLAAELRLPLSRRLPKQVQGKFMLACTSAKGTKSSCECIVVKQELDTKIEVGQIIAELLALEIAFAQEHATIEDIRRHRVLSPRKIRTVANQCK
jgi:hypothetical protein